MRLCRGLCFTDVDQNTRRSCLDDTRSIDVFDFGGTHYPLIGRKISYCGDWDLGEQDFCAGRTVVNVG